MANTQICVHTRLWCIKTRTGGRDTDNNCKSRWTTFLAFAGFLKASCFGTHGAVQPQCPSRGFPQAADLLGLRFSPPPFPPPPLISFALQFVICDVNSRNPAARAAPALPRALSRCSASIVSAVETGAWLGAGGGWWWWNYRVKPSE